MKMKVNVLVFGQLKDITGSGAMVIENVSDTEQLIHELATRFPDLRNSKFVVAVDKQITKQKMTLKADSPVALMPPFSGG